MTSWLESIARFRGNLQFKFFFPICGLWIKYSLFESSTNKWNKIKQWRIMKQLKFVIKTRVHKWKIYGQTFFLVLSGWIWIVTIRWSTWSYYVYSEYRVSIDWFLLYNISNWMSTYFFEFGNCYINWTCAACVFFLFHDLFFFLSLSRPCISSSE